MKESAMKSLNMFMAMAILSAPSLAFAALGGNVSTVQADSVHMKATLRIASTQEKYTVHEIETPSGTVVREYASPSGTVFAVTWRGPTIPDLHQVLGDYFDTFTQAAKAKHSGHSHLSVQQPGLVVHSSGHMRAFSGRAYVPSLVPQSVIAEEMQ
jgi:hypothetical protein